MPTALNNPVVRDREYNLANPTVDFGSDIGAFNSGIVGSDLLARERVNRFISDEFSRAPEEDRAAVLERIDDGVEDPARILSSLRQMEEAGKLPESLRGALGSARGIKEEAAQHQRRNALALSDMFVGGVGDWITTSSKSELFLEAILVGATLPVSGAFQAVRGISRLASAARLGAAEAVAASAAPALYGYARHRRTQEYYESFGEQYDAEGAHLLEIGLSAGLGGTLGTLGGAVTPTRLDADQIDFAAHADSAQVRKARTGSETQRVA